jgi:hypothetical protein
MCSKSVSSWSGDVDLSAFDLDQVHVQVGGWIAQDIDPSAFASARSSSVAA